MATNTLELAEKYLAAWQRKDLESIAMQVHPEIVLTRPRSHVAGKQAYLEAAKTILEVIKEFRVRSTFSSGNQVVFVYDLICQSPIGPCPTAELITFEPGLVASVELFYDPRPFEQIAGAQESSA